MTLPKLVLPLLLLAAPAVAADPAERSAADAVAAAVAAQHGAAASGAPAPHAAMGPGVNGAARMTPLAHAALVRGDGTPTGQLRIVQMQDHIMLAVELTGMPPGVHGIHLHTVAQCDAPGFLSAGAHLNPAGHQHGADNPAGSHLGDLPNVTADANGRVFARFGLRLAPDVLAKALFDADGSAVVVHAAADDYKTDPSGNSGARIACGVLKRG